MLKNEAKKIVTSFHEKNHITLVTYIFDQMESVWLNSSDAERFGRDSN